MGNVIPFQNLSRSSEIAGLGDDLETEWLCRELSRCRAFASHSGTHFKTVRLIPMNQAMTTMNPMTLPPIGSNLGSSWALRMKATTIDDPIRLIQTLTGAILGSGGWVLSRGANDSGTINMLFEFERMQCVEIYTMLIAAGLELSQLAHMRFTELCQCTRSNPEDRGGGPCEKRRYGHQYHCLPPRH